ncbi:hypothetical protein NDU88_010354 [Pleurodeles waltl]|uniref:Uncharacterized protein n=1 Tax=Pleurodeles waltl TaxID=8319 RepID=A0AAV7QX56_PLEWA|nr:hypothetical protein NDU88_010354 [Pleurodeles waltl]
MKDAREPDFMLISFILATRNKAHEQPAGRNTALCSRLCLSAAPSPDVTTVLATDWSWRHEAPKHRRQTSSVPPASLTKIDYKIDALSFRMDTMSKRLDKPTERLDVVERRMSDNQQTLALQKKIEKTLTTLQAKAEVIVLFHFI